MAVPFIVGALAGIAAVTGIVKGGSAISKNSKAKDINADASDLFEKAKKSALSARDLSNESLNRLGEAKLHVLDKSVLRFVDTFSKIKNVRLKESAGLHELHKFRLDQQAVIKMREMGDMAVSVLGGIAGGVGTGALAAFGAYSATMTFAAASTGTAIATLSGAAATNATLAFLGGGALAAGGGGVALGSMVLGGVVAGPAIAVLGFVMDSSASKNLDRAYSNRAEAEKRAEELKVVCSACNGIRARADMFKGLLDKLDSIFVGSIERIEEIVDNRGADFSFYTEDEQNSLAVSLSIAGAIKKILDTPILSDEGTLTTESEAVCTDINQRISCLTAS
jgi:hypothetical protein